MLISNTVQDTRAHAGRLARDVQQCAAPLSSDSFDPLRARLNVGGELYGTTGAGGANGDGTVFKVSSAGTFNHRRHLDHQNKWSQTVRRPGLIRAIEQIVGIALMKQNRGTDSVRDLTRRPGRLSAVLAIDRRLHGIDLCSAGPLWLGSDGQAPDAIGESKRIGITRAADSLPRFNVSGCRFVATGLITGGEWAS